MATDATTKLGDPTFGEAVAKRLSDSWSWIKTSSRKKPLGAVAAAWVLLLVFMSIFADVFPINDPLRIWDGMSNAPALDTPEGGRIFLLGGDTIGRDLLSRIIYGSRVSLMVSFGAVAMGISMGTVVGLACGFLGGKVDLVAQRVIDSAMAIPPLIIALTVVTLLGPNLFNIIFAISVIMIPHTSRIVRGLVMQLKENVYIEAARAIGAGNKRIAFLHILPNVTHGILIVSGTWLGAAVIVEATLSFLGQGKPPPDPTWGQMLSKEGRQNLVDNPMLLAAPSIAISSTVLAFNFLGDAMRDLLDPRLKS